MDSKHAKAKRFNFMKLNKKITWVNYCEKKKEKTVITSLT